MRPRKKVDKKRWYYTILCHYLWFRLDIRTASLRTLRLENGGWPV